MTDAELEQAIKRVYRRASEETTLKLEEYTKQFERLDRKWKADVNAGLKTKEEYKQWKLNKIAIGKRWEAVNTTLATDMLKADNEARSIINDYLPEAFAEGFNFACFQMATTMGDAYMNGAFTLYNKKAVEYLIKEEPTLLPQLNPKSKTAEKIRTGEIIRWNKQKISAEVTQGILQGESMPKIAKRMENVVGMNERSAIRNARTATNGAHNAGKERGFKDAQDMGIDVEQMWLASLDDRTRVTHRHLDGQIRKIGEPFTVDGYEIEYPCDPNAKPEMVYNCRCTLFPILPKYDKGLDLKDRDTSKMTQASYEEWKQSQPVYDTKKSTKTKTSEKSETKKVAEKATNKKEATNLLHNIGFGRVEGADKISEKLLVSNANRLAELNNRFGALSDGMTFRVEKFDGDFKDAIAHVGFTPKEVGAKSLNLNSKYFGRTNKMVETMASATRKNRWGTGWQMPVANDQREVAIVTHEYGHILENSLFNRGGILRNENRKATTKAYQKASEDAMWEIFNIAKDSNKDFDYNKVMSKYGRTNSAEFFAECFMNAFCGAPNEMGLAMQEWLRRKGL